MENEIIAALIGAGVAAAALVVQSVLTPVLARVFRSRDQERDLLERYAPTLGAAAEGLYYRLTEITTSGRHTYLRTESKPTAYHVYKFNSTIYRLASMIGWIWAIRTEQSLLAETANKNSSLHDSLKCFSSALADGAGVETWMIKELARLWNFPTPGDTEAAVAGAHLDSLVDNLSPASIINRREICDLPQLEQTMLLMGFSGGLAAKLNTASPDATFVEQTSHEACKILAARQSWIYRDWQTAIGETMMTRVENGPRVFEAKGYAQFEEMYAGRNRWLDEVANIFRDLDPQSSKLGDFREGQILAVREATAQIIIRLSTIKNMRSCVDPQLVTAIKAEFKNLK